MSLTSLSNHRQYSVSRVTCQTQKVTGSHSKPQSNTRITRLFKRPSLEFAKLNDRSGCIPSSHPSCTPGDSAGQRGVEKAPNQIWRSGRRRHGGMCCSEAMTILTKGVHASAVELKHTPRSLHPLEFAPCKGAGARALRAGFYSRSKLLTCTDADHCVFGVGFFTTEARFQALLGP